MKKLKIMPGALLALFLVTSCNSDSGQPKTTEKRVNVRIYPAKMESYQVPVRASGGLATRREMKLSFKTGGIIDRVFVREGQHVSEGTVLARLDLEEIKAQKEQARVSLDKARRDLERAKNLYNDSVATLEQFQDARSAFELARARQQIADFNYRHSYIKAPSRGKIQKVLMEANEMVSPGYPVLLFATTGNDWIVRVALTDRDVVRIAEGDTARIAMDAFPDRDFFAKVTELAAVADPVTGTYQAELQMQEVEPEFRTGYIARAEIFPSEVKKGCWVPMDAVIEASDNTAYVYVLDGIEPVKRKVLTGAIRDSGMMILEGISEGEMVITDGVSYLTPDSKINIVSSFNSLNP